MGTFLEPRLGLPQLVLTVAGLILAYEVCFRGGRSRPPPARNAKKSQADVAVAALLAMLGLLLAFSFGLAADRFDKRKTLVLDEANTIATTYLRAAMVPAPHDQRIRELLREYVRERSEVNTAEQLDRAIAASARLHAEMWSEATAVAQERPDSPIAALFITSLNQLIDLHEARITVALYQRLPRAIFAILYLVAAFAIGMVGLRAGLDRSRSPLPVTILIASITCVLALIASLDDPVSRIFQISKHALRDTQQMMKGRPD